jgi:hypothetical protein
MIKSLFFAIVRASAIMPMFSPFLNVCVMRVVRVSSSVTPPPPPPTFFL